MTMFAGSRLILPLGIAAGLGWLCSVPADSQDNTLKPTFGSVTLKVGFAPDPFKKELTAGGAIQTKLGGVTAHVAKAPDFQLHYTAGTLPLSIYATSKADTTLLVNLPNGSWVANDDGGGNLNPMLTFDKPLSGRYDIYVGTIGKDAAAATLFITELKTGPGKDPVTGPTPSLKPTFGAVTLKGGFAPDPFVKQLTAGGPIQTKLGGATAYVSNPPNFQLMYTAGTLPLTIHVESKADTTLLVNLPNGSWVANDDGGGNLNPMLKFAKPLSGRYDIYVGTLGKDTAPATLKITELK